MTARRVVRALRFKQHEVAVLEHIATTLLSTMTTAYEDQEPLVVRIDGVTQPANPRVVEVLYTELIEQAEKAKSHLSAMLTGDVTKIAPDDHDEDDDDGESAEPRYEVIVNPLIRQKRGNQ